MSVPASGILLVAGVATIVVASIAGPMALPAPALSRRGGSPLASAVAVPLSGQVAVGKLATASVGGPGAETDLERSPDGSEATATPLSLQLKVLPPVVALGGAQVASAANPGSRHSQRVQGPLGETASAEALSPTAARSQAQINDGIPGVAVTAVVASTLVESTMAVGLTEAQSSVVGLGVAGVSVASFKSSIEVQARPGAAPLVTYYLTVIGARVNGRSLLGLGSGILHVGGQDVALADLVADFETEAGRSGGKNVGAVLRLVPPTVEVAADGITITSPALVIALPGSPVAVLGLSLGTASLFLGVPAGGSPSGGATSPASARSGSNTAANTGGSGTAAAGGAGVVGSPAAGPGPPGLIPRLPISTGLLFPESPRRAAPSRQNLPLLLVIGAGGLNLVLAVGRSVLIFRRRHAAAGGP